MRSLHMMAAVSAMALMAADKGSGGKSDAPDLLADQADPGVALAAANAHVETLQAEIGELTSKLETVTKERDEALSAGATAIGELKQEVVRLGDLVAERGRDLASARDVITELDAKLSEAGAPAPRRTASRPADGHYVLQTSKIEDLARGRIITVGAAKAAKWLAAGKIRQATVAEVENARQEIVHL
ncbi:hypothetical protein OVA11_19060 [Caulobacter sp. SL161]|uniref:hypothetical protein n=1 Tax=Caulobacter sp. SL161 TaxID=2995156 RepID=UPI002276208F|nr:hypothetical protein [Caulobacter sp. SL161]MCY1649078.1 hypothetical protein [Caulobacter sp. SL161]